MNREILKAKIAEAISSTNTSGNEKLEAILAAVDTYSSAGNGTKPLVSGSLLSTDFVCGKCKAWGCNTLMGLFEHREQCVGGNDA